MELALHNSLAHVRLPSAIPQARSAKGPSNPRIVRPIVVFLPSSTDWLSHSPRPAEPLTKGFDALRAAQQAKDKAIEKRIRPPYPTELPPDDDAEVDKFLRKRGMVWKCAREQVSDVDLSRLRPGQWLNDEIINFYGAMILARSEANKENPKSVKVHYFSSFFWSKLKTTGYEKGRLGKWTKTVRPLSF